MVTATTNPLETQTAVTLSERRMSLATAADRPRIPVTTAVARYGASGGGGGNCVLRLRNKNDKRAKHD